ncbi:MAG: butyrate kinase [Erysipelotrichaceae bacterium]|nr:butyrate kinase [Erysipelotrichaceae bacterium]
MKNGIYKIFVINPGSTSTKLSLFHNEEHILTTDVFHDSSVLKTFPTINDQLDYRMEVIRNFIKENELDLSDLDAIVGRGGPCYAVESGTFEVDDLLIADTKAGKGGLYHASMLGVQMAREMQKEYGGRIFMLDPTVVDEYWDLSRISGIDGIYRHSICHALNLKATARKHAASLGKRYEDCRFIVCHIDGGISVTAHVNGRMVDGNDAGGGQGPFTPTRMGSMAVTDVVDYLWDKTPQEMKNLTSVVGGLSSYFGTSNTDKIHELIDAGDKRANRVWDAMIYQIAKYIGAMASAMSGKVDAIVLTGGLLRFPEIEEKIRGYCGYIAPVSSYPGECEQEAMCLGALRVLRGEEEPKHYTGHPVWQGFND